MRDWVGSSSSSAYTNEINHTTTLNAFSTIVQPSGNEIRLDMQTIDLPVEFHTQTLTHMRITDLGSIEIEGDRYLQRSFLAGLTVETIPEPATLAWLTTAALFAFRRRNRR